MIPIATTSTEKKSSNLDYLLFDKLVVCCVYKKTQTHIVLIPLFFFLIIWVNFLPHSSLTWPWSEFLLASPRQLPPLQQESERVSPTTMGAPPWAAAWPADRFNEVRSWRCISYGIQHGAYPLFFRCLLTMLDGWLETSRMLLSVWWPHTNVVLCADGRLCSIGVKGYALFHWRECWEVCYLEK